MKSVIAFVAIALIAVFIVPSESVKTCAIRCDLSSTTEVCAMSGTVCRRFTNNCAHKLYNCVNSKSYAAVALSRCRSISVGYSGTCKAATTSSSTVSTSSIYNSLSSLYGSYGGYGSASVTPIIIRV